MIKYTFTVRGEKRLNETKAFIRKNMQSGRFDGNPFKLFNDSWRVSVTANGNDMNLLMAFLVDYDTEDRLAEEKKKQSVWDKIKALFI